MHMNDVQVSSSYLARIFILLTSLTAAVHEPQPSSERKPAVVSVGATGSFYSHASHAQAEGKLTPDADEADGRHGSKSHARAIRALMRSSAFTQLSAVEASEVAGAKVVDSEEQMNTKQQNDLQQGHASLAGAGVMGKMVQTLVTWLRGSATLEEIYAAEQFRQWMAGTSSPQKATVLLQDTMVPDEWNSCADEGYKCLCPTGMMRYGREDHDAWVYKNVSRQVQSVNCGNDFFGKDPAPGSGKSCGCMALWRVVVCRDGNPVDWKRCPIGARSQSNMIHHGDGTSFAEITGEHLCSEGCDRSTELKDESVAVLVENGSRIDARTDTRLPAVALETGERGKICSGVEPHDLLWSCEKMAAEPSSPHEKQLNKAAEVMCSDPKTAKALEVYLDCDFAENYRYWMSKSNHSHWLEEAYVTYIGGKKGSDYEWQATNLARSVELFSTRPIVIVSFTNHYAPPVSWRKNKNVLVYRMQPGKRDVSFNFNKIRAMIGARALTGIQQDTDQIIASGMDNVFASTRREVDEQYPYPILPVHWMSRDAKEGEPYHNYMQTGYEGPHTMRWGQAHPTWTFWALPFLTELLHERLNKTGSDVKPWMGEDEDMLNVKMWKAGADKQWCKFDLFPDLFVKGHDVETKVYHDAHWYPNGIGLVFYGSHATKEFSSADWLLSLLARCSDPDVSASVTCKSDHNADCWGHWVGEQRKRFTTPEEHTAEMCCCLRPRDSTPFFFNGNWYKDRSEVPDMTAEGGNSKCLFP